MKQLQPSLFIFLAGLSIQGCSSDAPQASAQLAKQFSGGPMPADARAKFEESSRKAKDASQQRAQNGGGK